MDIDLTEDEQGWWDNIRAYFLKDSGEFLEDRIGEQQVSLTRSLFKRGAIPERRLEWLTNGDFHIGMKKSRLEMIRHNAGNKPPEEVFSLDFWGRRYLPFLLGIIDLPQGVIDDFRTDAKKRMNDCYDMGEKYRRIAKECGLKKDDAEEFFKLAVDCGYNHSGCRTIRDAIFTYLRK